MLQLSAASFTFVSLKSNCYNPMCPCEEIEPTPDRLIFQCKKLRNKRNEMIKQIENTVGNWPTANEMFVNIYLQVFKNLLNI